MSKVILTDEQKKKWVYEEYANGRIHAMTTIDTTDDIVLDTMCLELLNYDDFGSGDETETKLWKKILSYLRLEEAYTKYWEDAL